MSGLGPCEQECPSGVPHNPGLNLIIGDLHGHPYHHHQRPPQTATTNPNQFKHLSLIGYHRQHQSGCSEEQLLPCPSMISSPESGQHDELSGGSPGSLYRFSFFNQQHNTSSPHSDCLPGELESQSHSTLFRFNSLPSSMMAETMPAAENRDPAALADHPAQLRPSSVDQSLPRGLASHHVIGSESRFAPYPKPNLNFTTPSTSLQLGQSRSSKPSRSRKRTVILRPKNPRYQGLSSFAAPADLLSEVVVPDSKENQEPGGLSPLSTNQSPSCRYPLPRNTDATKSCSDSMDLKEHNAEASASDIPIDFLKHLPYSIWSKRKADLEKLVAERKQIFLQGGFAETSGKPFEAGEQAIEKKPVPNRWVWYLRLSTDYDKIMNTTVPSGGPAGYLKYGWDRLGPVGKQAYQELADIYSAQRVKYMAEHGIEEDLTRKTKPRRGEKSSQGQSPNQAGYFDEPTHQQILGPLTNLPAEWRSNPSPPLGLERQPSSNTHGAIEATYGFSPPSTLEATAPCDEFGQPSELASPLIYREEAAEKYDLTREGVPFVASYLQSPEFLSDFFYSLARQDLLGRVEAVQRDQQTEQLGSPIKLLSSPVSDSIANDRSPRPTFPTMHTSEFNSWSTFSPCSVPSNVSEISGAIPTPRGPEAHFNPGYDTNTFSPPGSFHDRPTSSFFEYNENTSSFGKEQMMANGRELGGFLEF